jgi:hypothetical protein
MGRHITAATPSPSLWASAESAIRMTLKTLSAPAAQISALEELDGEQARLRSTSRHWLIG